MRGAVDRAPSGKSIRESFCPLAMDFCPSGRGKRLSGAPSQWTFPPQEESEHVFSRCLSRKRALFWVHVHRPPLPPPPVAGPSGWPSGHVDLKNCNVTLKFVNQIYYFLNGLIFQSFLMFHHPSGLALAPLAKDLLATLPVEEKPISGLTGRSCD